MINDRDGARSMGLVMADPTTMIGRWYIEDCAAEAIEMMADEATEDSAEEARGQ